MAAAFDDHLGVVSLDDNADGDWECVDLRAVVILAIAGVTCLEVHTGSTAFHCRDLPDGSTYF